MWLRMLGLKGNSQCLVLPPEPLRVLGWERGDYIVVTMPSANQLLLTKAMFVSLPDRVLGASKPVPIINHD